MVAAETMTGIDNHTVVALPHDRLREALKKYNRLDQQGGREVTVTSLARPTGAKPIAQFLGHALD